MIAIRSSAIKYLFRVNNAPYVRYRKKIDGSFFYKNRHWYDAVLLKRKIPSPSIMEFLVNNYAVSFSEIGMAVPRINFNRRVELVMLMLTAKEVSILTRIPEGILDRAVLLGEIKTITLGSNTFIPRRELERLLGFIINEEKLREVVINTLTQTRKRFLDY